MPAGGGSASSGLVVWITGFSGAGKSTVAALLQRRLRTAGVATLLLDGDALRRILGRETGFAPEERLELAWIYARLAQEIAHQGVTVLCATISMFKAVRDWNRLNNSRYVEVYLKVPEGERAARDRKGVYAQKTPADARYEEPATPDLTIENWGTTAAQQAAAAVWNYIVVNGKCDVGNGQEAW